MEENVAIQKARQAMQNAYVPYSHFKVGACLIASDGRYFTGCNVENASYGLTCCAERTAIYKAVSEGVREFEAIAIAAEDSLPFPCGACRQVLHEFAPELKVITVCGSHIERHVLDELLPHGFGPKSLL